MDFRPSVEQGMLRESARRYVSTEQSFEKRQRRLAQQGQDDWQKMSEMGWLAMAVSEDAGGIGSELTDVALVCEELGRGLSLEPFVACALLPALILNRAIRTPLVDSLLENIVGGTRVSVALHERKSRYELLAPHVQAIGQTDGSLRLVGTKILVGGGGLAEWLIVSARLEAGAVSSPCALILVEAAQTGIERRCYRTLDDVEAADIEFSDVVVAADRVLGFAGETRICLEFALDEACICLCADVIGGMARAVEMTAEYLKMRTQFGKPLAEFQVLQHSVAEMFVELTGARAILCHALGALSGEERLRRRAVSGCKVKVMEAAKSVLGMAIHLHGGIGVTSEYPVGHYLKRAMVLERLLGDSEHHLQRYMQA